MNNGKHLVNKEDQEVLERTYDSYFASNVFSEDSKGL
jgi:hypothetical protein